jgi:hypothetical protein
MTLALSLPESPPCRACGHPQQRYVGEPKPDGQHAWVLECPLCGTRTPVTDLLLTATT